MNNQQQDKANELEQSSGAFGVTQNNNVINSQYTSQLAAGNLINNFNKQQYQTFQSISEAPERDESSALHFDEDLVHSQRFNSQFLEQSQNQKSHFQPNQNQQFNSIYTQLKMDQQSQHPNVQGIEKQGLQNNIQNQQIRNQYYITKVDNNNMKSNTNNSGVAEIQLNKIPPTTNMDEIQKLIKASSQRIAQSEQLVAVIDERSSEGSLLPQKIQSGIPFEIKDYAIQGNVSAKQSLLNCERGEFYEGQLDQQNEAINSTQSLPQSIPVQDKKKQEMLETLQQNLNLISNMMQKNNLQQPPISPKNDELNDIHQVTTAQDTEESKQGQFDTYFQQSIQKQLQNIRQVKAQGEYSSQIQQQVLSQQKFLSPQSHKNQQIVGQNSKQVASNQPSSSKKSVQSYQQLYNSNKISSPSPSHNLKSFEKSSLSNKQSPGSNPSGKSSLASNMSKTRDFQETYKPSGQNMRAQTTPNQDSKKVLAIHHQYHQQQLNQYQQHQQQPIGQYIPLYQQIQNQIRISEDSVKQQPQKQLQQLNQQQQQQQQQQSQQQPQSQQNYQQQLLQQQQQLQQKQLSQEENDKILHQQQLIEKQKQIILKRYEETIKKQQQELNQKQELNQRKNSQDSNTQNQIRQKQQSMIQQRTESAVATEQSPARRKTVDQSSQNASPKHIYLKLEKYKSENENKEIGQDEIYNEYQPSEQLNQNQQSSKRVNTESSNKQYARNSSQKQLTENKNQQSQQKSASTNNIMKINNFINTDQQMKNMQGDNHQQNPLVMNKGSSYQNQSSLQLIRKMMEQKDFKKLEVPKDNDSQDKGYQDYRISYENQQSPEIKNKKKLFQNEEQSGKMDETSKTEKSGSAGRDYSIGGQRSNENQSSIANGGIEQSFNDDRKTEMSIQSLSKSITNPMKLSNISKGGKMRNSQESMMKSFEERKKYTFATNNQKCIILSKGSSDNHQQNNSMNKQNPHQQSYMNSKIGSGTAITSKEDIYFVYGSMESLHSTNPLNQQYPQSPDQLIQQNYLNQQQYEDHVRQSQILQHEDEEALQHQMYLRQQDLILQQQQQHYGYNPNHPSPQVYEYTDQGFIKTNALLEQDAIKLNEVPIIHDFEDVQSEIQNIETSQQQQSGIMSSNHMTFGPNQQNNLKQHMVPGQVEIQNESYQTQNTQLNVVNVNQMLKMNQIQTNQTINLESYQVSNIQSPDNHRLQQQQGASVYSSVAHLSPQSYHQQNQLRGRLGSNNSNIIKLNTSTDTCNLSRISNKTGNNYNQPNMSGITGSVIGNINQGNSYIKYNNATSSSNHHLQTQQNQSYISVMTNNTNNKNQKNNDRLYTNTEERTPTNAQQINKKEFNWLDYSSFDRNNIWLKLKQQNRYNLQQELDEKEQIKCTFKPSLIATKKPSLQKQYTQGRLQTTKIPPTYSSNKKNLIRDYSDNSRINKGNGYINHQNPTANTTMNMNNGPSQNVSSYQLNTSTKPNPYNYNNTINSGMKQSQLQYNISPIQNIDQPYQFLSQAQSPTSLHQEIKKATSYTQISQIKKNIASTPNLTHGIPSTAPNSSTHKQKTQQSSKKQTPYKPFKPGMYQ